MKDGVELSGGRVGETLDLPSTEARMQLADQRGVPDSGDSPGRYSPIGDAVMMTVGTR